MNRHSTYGTNSDSSYNIVLLLSLGIIFLWTCTARFLYPNDELLLLWLDVPLICFVLHLMMLPSELKYTVRSGQLTCKNALFKKVIEVREITEIERSFGWHNFAFQFAAGTSGLWIKYGRFRRVFITPDNQRDFIELMLLLNPEIKIK